MSSALLIACCQIAYALLPSLLHDRASPLTSHRHATHLAPLLVMRSRRPPAGMYTSCVLFRCPTPPPEVTFFPADVAERMGCDASLPLLSSLEVFAFCSHFLGSSGTWFLASRQAGRWCVLCFSVLSSSSHPWHTSWSDQPMSKNLFCTHPPSTTNFLITLRCVSVHFSMAFSSTTLGSVPAKLLPSVPRIRARPPSSSKMFFWHSVAASYFNAVG